MERSNAHMPDPDDGKEDVDREKHATAVSLPTPQRLAGCPGAPEWQKPATLYRRPRPQLTYPVIEHGVIQAAKICH
jgi:hypothetical protein